jgi:hypothetical protein
MRYEHHWSDGRGTGGAFLDFASRMKHSCHISFDAAKCQFVVTNFRPGNLLLTSPWFSRIKEAAAVAATRGDLGQLAPRKKLLKS